MVKGDELPDQVSSVAQNNEDFVCTRGRTGCGEGVVVGGKGRGVLGGRTIEVVHQRGGAGQGCRLRRREAGCHGVWWVVYKGEKIRAQRC
jgi:hypothetical protein